MNGIHLVFANKLIQEKPIYHFIPLFKGNVGYQVYLWDHIIITGAEVITIYRGRGVNIYDSRIGRY